MTATSAILNHPLMREVGWTLLHSLWQGAVIGLIFLALRVGLRRQSANTRYLAGCACLVLFAAAPLLTFLHETTPAPAVWTAPYPVSGPPEAVVPLLGPGSLGPAFHGDGTGWPSGGGSESLTRLVPILALGWLLGVVFFSARLTRSFWSVRGIYTHHNAPVAAAWLETLDELRHRLGVSRPVRLLKSALVEVPTVIGWFRPVILLPAATLSGLTPGQLEAILAHELAHVRRLDYLVNAFQCAVETLMFYHPAAWWISRCIREERENCCDDLVVKVCGDRLGYARALVTLEGLRTELPGLAIAASGGSLLGRIRRLVGADSERGGVTVHEVGGLGLLGVGMVLVILGVRMFLSPTSYQSTARVRIQYDPMGDSRLSGQHGGPGYDPSFIQNELDVIRSEAVLSKVIKALDLNQAWGMKYAGGVPLKPWQTLALLRARLDLGLLRGTNLIQLCAASDKPDEAAKLANAIAEAYWAQRQEKHSQEEEENLARDMGRVQSLRAFAIVHDPTANEAVSSRLAKMEALRELEARCVDLKAGYVRQMALVDHLKRHEKDSGREGLVQAIQVVARDALLSALLESLAAAERQSLALKNERSPAQSEVSNSQGQVDILHKKINERAAGIMLGLETRAESLSQLIEKLQQEISRAITNDVMRAIQPRPNPESERAAEEVRRFHQVLLDTKVIPEKAGAGLLSAAIVEIIDRAAPALCPVSPNLRGGVVVTVLGVLLNITGIFVLRGQPGTGSDTHPARLAQPAAKGTQ